MSYNPTNRQQQPQQQQQQQQQQIRSNQNIHPQQHMVQQTPQRPQQLQYPPNSPYAEPGSPIASVVQRKPKADLNSPQIHTAPTSQVHYIPGTPPQRSQQKGTNRQPPISPQLFSPRTQRPQMQNQHSTRYRHPDLIDTAILHKEIPFLEDFGTPQEQPPNGKRPLTIAYSPPCMEPLRLLLKCNEDLSGPNPQQAREDYVRCLSDFQDEIQPFLLIRNLPALPRTPRKSPIPPKRSDAPKITLVLDLDETLVHCTLQPPQNNGTCAFTFPVDFNGQNYNVYAQIRPHLDYFLRQVAQWFEIIIFTASQKSYADTLLNIVDPMNEFVTHRVFRDSCVHVDSNYIKDLSVLGRNLEHLIIVDNSFQAFGYHLSNGIPIESWFQDDQDSQLLTLIPLLRQLKDVHDVRPYLRDYFRLQTFVDQLREPM